ncbi:hypothetical protein [Tritonibacter horizontis]|nr:hypothetical protein [Tritonibacter horizontis]
MAPRTQVLPDPRALLLALFLGGLALLLTTQVARAAADLRQFVGTYTGSAEVVQLNGEAEQRDMSVSIWETEDGFAVQWSTAIRRADGREKTKNYEIEFQPSERRGVYSAAMKTNVFGHTVQMNPMKGEPFIWARVIEDTLTVFSLYVAENGDYLMQQYDRSLADGGLRLDFSLHRNGVAARTVTTFLNRSE